MIQSRLHQLLDGVLEKTTFSFLNGGGKRSKKAVEHNRSNTILDRLRLNNPLQLTHLFQPPLRAWKNITRSRFDISNGKLFDRAKSLSKILSSRSGLTDI